MLETITSILCRLTVFVFGGGAMKLAILTPASFSLHTVFLTRQERKREGEEGRVWSRCNYQVVTEKWTSWLDNKMLTSDVIVLHDNGCNPQRARIWLVTSSFSYGDNLNGCSLTGPFLSAKGVACETRQFTRLLKVVWSWDYYTLWTRTRVEYIRRDWRINRTEDGAF